MENRTTIALEFDRVLAELAGRCVSEAGGAAALALQPVKDQETVQSLQTYLAQVMDWQAMTGFKLPAFPNIGPLIELLAATGQVTDPEALWAARESLNSARLAMESVASGEKQWFMLQEKAARFPFPASASSALNRCLGEDGQIKDESSPALLIIRSGIRSLHQGCLHRVREYAEEYNIGQYLQGEYMTLASDRYVLPIKANFKGRLQGVVHDYSRTGETMYFEPLFLVEQNNRLQDLKRQEREEENKILRMLSNLLAENLPGVSNAWDFLVDLDLNLAKALLASDFEGRCVSLDQGAVPDLKQARHPILFLENKKRGQSGKVEPIDLVLRHGDRILVISGGNAGGKTVALKTMGLIVMMTMAGLPAPVAAGSSLPILRNVHAFIGDEQSLDDNVSTFTGQIQHLSKIWDGLDAHSLVLLDEFGAGTDPSQGAALAQAVLDGLLEKQTYALTATHFPALKTYAMIRDGVRAASVVFHPATKKPLYYLAYDQVGASQALDVAREHGLPASVLQRAEQYLLLEGQDSQAVMERLNHLAAEREKELDLLRKEKDKAREKRQNLQASLEKERTRLQEDLRRQSQELLHAWKSGKATAKQAMKEMAKLRTELKPEPDLTQAGLNQKEIKPGMNVRHRPWNKIAKILEVDPKSAKAKIDMNGVSLWANLTDLENAPARNAPLAERGSGHLLNRSSASPVFLRLDLRGKRADLALAELEQFLDNALLSNSDNAEIIHGRGTGALRKSVHEFLKKYPGIASYETANEDQGGDGVTLAYFR